MKFSIRISVIILLLAFATQASAQKKRKRPSKTAETTTKTTIERSSVKKTKGSKEFRIELGGNLSTNNLVDQEFSFGPGYHGGVGFVFYFSSKIKMRYSLLYSYRTYNFDPGFSASLKVTQQHISTPALFEFQLNRFAFFAGPHFNYLLKAEQSSTNGDPFGFTDDFRLSVGTQIGIGYDILQSDLGLRIEAALKSEDNLVSGDLSLVFLF